MSQLPISLPAEFDHAAFTEQISEWLTEGHSDQDIVSQAAFQWPGLTQSFIQTAIQQGKSHDKKTVKPIDPLRDLYIIHRKRNKHIRKVEAQLEDEKAPVSLHTLYRGLLRDQEASCYKMIAMNQDELHQQTQSSRQDSAVPLPVAQPDKATLKPNQPPVPYVLSSMQKVALLLCLVGSIFLVVQARITPALHSALQPYILPLPDKSRMGDDDEATKLSLLSSDCLHQPGSPSVVQRLATIPRRREEWHSPGNGPAA